MPKGKKHLDEPKELAKAQAAKLVKRLGIAQNREKRYFIETRETTEDSTQYTKHSSKRGGIQIS
jgi:hypothetical protein